jgi:hypothetical protein
MNKQGRSQLALGVLLILAGVWFFLDRTNPQFHELFVKYTAWPLNMFLIGAGILLLGLATGSPGLAVPAAVVAGVGGVIYYQKVYERQDAWYAWILLLGCVGVGNVVQGLLGDNAGRNFRQGLKMIVFSVAIFFAFSAFFGDLKLFGAYGPAILLILLGLWTLGSGLYRSYRNKDEAQ